MHPWHTDIESSAPEGGFVSVWIGVEHTSHETSLQVISGSHRLGRSVQEVRAERGIAREEAGPDVLLRIAREDDPEACIVVPDMTDGDALFFDGRLWHGTNNRRARGERVALLLQYAAADRVVRIPDWKQLDWPFRLREVPLPPVVPVRGTPQRAVNCVVAPPPPASSGTTAPVRTIVHAFDLDAAVCGEPPQHPWQPFPAFSGRTPVCDVISCHASVLAPGHSPHAPHAHAEEEILIALRGEAELVVPSEPSDPEPRVERLLPGSLVYYPAWQLHTIRNPGREPIAYLMFKWQRPWREEPHSSETRIEHFGAQHVEGLGSFRSRLLFETPTDYLGKLHAHVTLLEPSAGYEPHGDVHDVAILTLEGTVETLSQPVGPGSVVFYGAGEPHGMLNTGPGPARYLVFEFHPPGVEHPR